MKKYIKPEITTVNFSANSSIASGLTTWLETNADGASFDQVITTYAYES